MSLFQYLKLQPIDPQDDGTVSELDQFAEDDTIDLSQDEDGEVLVRKLEEMSRDMHSDGTDQ